MKISHGDSYLAEEMVQTVFLKVWKNREQLDPKLSFGAYLCTIAKNLLTNHYQHKMMEILLIKLSLKTKNSLMFPTNSKKQQTYQKKIWRNLMNQRKFLIIGFVNNVILWMASNFSLRN